MTKRTLAMLLALALCVCAASAVAEETVEIPVIEDGTWVAFEDYGFEICLPSDWNVMEVTEDQAAVGVHFSCINPEQTRSFTLAYNDLDEATDAQALAAQLATVYSEVQLVNINGLDFVSYTIPEQDVTGILTLGGEGTGLHQFVFTPASDADYGPLAVQIAASISPLE